MCAGREGKGVNPIAWSLRSSAKPGGKKKRKNEKKPGIWKLLIIVLEGRAREMEESGPLTSIAVDGALEKKASRKATNLTLGNDSARNPH